MIETIQGRIASLNPAAAVIETAGGVGYLVNITLPTFTALQGRSEARMFIHESIRDDAWVLYGFLDDDEREIFRALVSVSGVGAQSARMILSSLAPAQLREVIVSGDIRSLKSVKGIGTKTAERIIVDLRDKIKVDPDTLITGTPAQAGAAMDEALEALVILGFNRSASEKALRKLFEADPGMSVEAALKRAMTML